uniref:Radical SAM core domain-containing protein n=1 Tax=Thermosporothrix sp. COM3 TaxID=2490863 RepID=A0A455SGZ8_9CHLR|nr:hypothetical protein KTC_17770 [Thermosporothrix sp. COM3]
MGQPCRFGCRYCYTRGGEIGPARIEPLDIVNELKEFASEHAFDVIQFGYDGDPFARPERGIFMLQHLATLGKDICFSTKAALDQPTLDALADLDRYLYNKQATLSALISLSCWSSAAQIEPHTPLPHERLRSLSNLRELGIPAFIAVRPMLPHVRAEYPQLIDAGIQAGTNGFILGPLYADDDGRFIRFMPKGSLEHVPHRKVTVSWSPHTPQWTRYEDESLVSELASFIRQRGGSVFLSSVEAMRIAPKLRQKEI